VRYERRIKEREKFFTARRAAGRHQLERPLGQPLRELARIGDRGGRTDDLRIGAIVPCDPSQASEDVAQVAAEDAAIRVQLVDHDIAEVFEQLRPARMVRQDPRMEHVGVAEHDMRARANRPARIRLRVAVVSVYANRVGTVCGELADELVQVRHLILRQRFGRKQVERTR
jgi:hypothetical protein